MYACIYLKRRKLFTNLHEYWTVFKLFIHSISKTNTCRVKQGVAGLFAFCFPFLVAVKRVRVNSLVIKDTIKLNSLPLQGVSNSFLFSCSQKLSFQIYRWTYLKEDLLPLCLRGYRLPVLGRQVSLGWRPCGPWVPQVLPRGKHGFALPQSVYGENQVFSASPRTQKTLADAGGKNKCFLLFMGFPTSWK